MDQAKMCLNAHELSMQTGLSLSTIRKLTREDKIPHLRVGRRVLYPIIRVEQWLESNTGGEENEK